MSVLTLILVRHAEKPDRGFPGPGLTVDGERNDESLVIRGWQRAGAWAALFGSGLDSTDYPRPVVVYAADPDAGTDDSSQRPLETATPLAARLGLDIVKRFGVGAETALVDELVKLTGVVVVFWEHKSIAAAIIPALRGEQRLPGVPEKWDGDRFDVALRFDRALPGSPWSFRQLSPRLLSGDSEMPFKKVAS